MNPPTVIVANLIPRLKEHAAKSLKDYLQNGGELSSILESIEFWYDLYRDNEHPDLPMWSVLRSEVTDQLFDAWIEALEDGILARRVSSPSPASSPSPLSSPLEQAKTSQEAPVCEVEQLREVSYGIIKQICRSLHALGAPIGVLAAVGSWGDTLEESEVLELMEAENARLVPQVTGSESERFRHLALAGLASCSKGLHSIPVREVASDQSVTLPKAVVEGVAEKLEFILNEYDWKKIYIRDDGYGGDKRIGLAISSALSSLRAALKPQA
jgi:hypothetical protein